MPQRDGVLPSQALHEVLAREYVRSERLRIPERNVQPASLDLHLGERAFRLRSSFLPGLNSVDDRLAEHSMEEIDLRDGAVLEKNRPYLIPLIEELALPDWLRGRTNPRSSTGRLDIFTRVVTDYGQHFDEIPPGYRGRLFLEVVSRSFTIKVRTGHALNQLRLIVGAVQCTDDDLAGLHASSPVVFVGREPLPPDDLRLNGGLFLSIDLSNQEFVGYRAKRNSALLDLSKSAYYDPTDFWDKVRAERGMRIVLEPEEFYLLVSRERVRIPPEYAAEMAAYDPTSGELRTHYAGFFDPGFGDVDGDTRGTPAVMEVRAHDVPFMLEHGQRVCRLTFERMQEPPAEAYGSGIGSRYQRQYLALGRQFQEDGSGRLRDTLAPVLFPDDAIASGSEGTERADTVAGSVWDSSTESVRR